MTAACCLDTGRAAASVARLLQRAGHVQLNGTNSGVPGPVWMRQADSPTVSTTGAASNARPRNGQAMAGCGLDIRRGSTAGHKPGFGGCWAWRGLSTRDRGAAAQELEMRADAGFMARPAAMQPQHGYWPHMYTATTDARLQPPIEWRHPGAQPQRRQALLAASRWPAYAWAFKGLAAAGPSPAAADEAVDDGTKTRRTSPVIRAAPRRPATKRNAMRRSASAADLDAGTA